MINAAYFNGSNLRALINTDITEPGIVSHAKSVSHGAVLMSSETLYPFYIDGLAWDWVNHKLYWTDAGNKDIEVYDVVNQYRKKLIQKGTNALPRAIVLDPANK